MDPLGVGGWRVAVGGQWPAQGRSLKVAVRPRPTVTGPGGGGGGRNGSLGSSAGPPHPPTHPPTSETVPLSRGCLGLAHSPPPPPAHSPSTVTCPRKVYSAKGVKEETFSLISPPAPLAIPPPMVRTVTLTKKQRKYSAPKENVPSVYWNCRTFSATIVWCTPPPFARNASYQSRVTHHSDAA